MPYQMASPEHLPATDMASVDASTALLALAAGDVVVAGTDGLWDNMWPEQAAELIAEVTR